MTMSVPEGHFSVKIHADENKRRVNNQDEEFSSSTFFPDSDLIDFRTIDNSFKVNLDSSQKPWILTKKSHKVGIVPMSHFSKRFTLASAGACSFLNWDHIVVAGGCVSNALNASVPENKLPTDIDLFLYGCTPEEANAKIVEIIREVTGYFQRLNEGAENSSNSYWRKGKIYSYRNKNGSSDSESSESDDSEGCSESDSDVDSWSTQSCRVFKNDYVISIIPTAMKYRVNKVQIILRQYQSIHEILAGFDVDSCAVAFNGLSVLGTARSVQAFQSGYNLVDLARRSPSYEHRLYKYYQRGFGILVPFDCTGYNQLYFLNRQSKGLDRLIYLLGSDNSYRLSNFLTKVTGRKIALKYGSAPSNYEGVAEFKTDSKNLEASLKRFNSMVEPEFQYKVLGSKYRSVSLEDLKECEFITTNPGQQFTGSFHPITTGDWVKVNYAEYDLDHLGRGKHLLAIRQNTYTLSDLYDQQFFDTSLFNSFHLLMMFSSNTNDLVDAWNSRLRIPNKIPNTYGISWPVMAVLNKRTALVNVMVQDLLKESSGGAVTARDPDSDDDDGYSRRRKEPSPTELLKSVVDAVIFMDDPEMMTILSRHLEGNSDDYLSRRTVKGLAEKYGSNRIREALFYRVKSKEPSESLQSTVLKIEPKMMADWFLKNGHRQRSQIWTKEFWSSELVERLQHQDLVWIYHNCQKEQAIELFKPFIKKMVIRDPESECLNTYPYDSFERHLLGLAFQKRQGCENAKSYLASQNVYHLFKHFYQIDQETMDSWMSETIDQRNLLTYSPNNLYLIRMIFENSNLLPDYLNQPENRVNLRENKVVRRYLYQTDNLEALKLFVSDDYMISFLTDYPGFEKSGTIAQHLEELKTHSLAMDDLHRNLAEPFENTTDHLNAVETGVLNDNYQRTENIFGQTPDDYIINSLLELYSKYHSSEAEESRFDYGSSKKRAAKRSKDQFDESSDDEATVPTVEETGVMEMKDLTLLNNLRQSVGKIRREVPIVRTTLEQASKPCLVELFKGGRCAVPLNPLTLGEIVSPPKPPHAGGDCISP